jgi:hypothetical protein
VFIIKGIKLPKITGIAIWPFVIVKTKMPGKIIINHEKIHLRQQVEMLVIPFYIWYLLEWVVRFIALRNFNAAYLSISFEKEAYKNEKDFNYLKNRGFWSFLKYL